MALEKTDIQKYQKMTNAELVAKAAEIQQLAERPKAAVGAGSRLWFGVKAVGLAILGGIAGKWLSGSVNNLIGGNKIGSFIANNMGWIGMGTATAIGVANMRGNRKDEVAVTSDLELQKIQAVLHEREVAAARAQQAQITADDMARMNAAHANRQAVGQHTSKALAGQNGQQLGV
jgi:hypothetical protein